MPKLIWKRVENEWHDPSMPEGYTYRAKVPGGWLVSVWAGTAKEQKWGGGLTFMPDAGGEWLKQVDEATYTPPKR